jgi:hypothetical protein
MEIYLIYYDDGTVRQSCYVSPFDQNTSHLKGAVKVVKIQIDHPANPTVTDTGGVWMYEIDPNNIAAGWKAVSGF